MKKLLKCLLCIAMAAALLFSISGCQKELDYIEFESTSVQTSGGKAVMLIDSACDLKNVPGFEDACDVYDETYFDGKVFLYVSFDKSKDSIGYEIVDLAFSENKGLYITVQKYDYSTIRPDLVGSSGFLIEIDDDYDPRSVSNIYINGQQQTA